MAMNSGSSTGLVVRNNEIHHTGLSSGTTEEIGQLAAVERHDREADGLARGIIDRRLD